MEVARVGFLLLLIPVAIVFTANRSYTRNSLQLKNYYKVALFEHARRGNWTIHTPAEIKKMNLRFYRRAVEEASSQGADIIAFPEYGIVIPLTRKETKAYLENVPDPRKGRFNPCEKKSEFSNRVLLQSLSCLAKKNRIYILVNMGDIQPCSKKVHEKCPDDGAFHFNTNVVFDRDGTIISRYYKERLFFESAMDLPLQPQDPFFTTDFGTFASFISFDIMFERLPLALRNESVNGVILSAMWVDKMPLHNSMEFWQSLAIGNNSTFLVVNTQIPGFLALGSGVFTAQLGALNYTFNPDGLSKLIVSRVPKNKHQRPPFPNPHARITVITADGTQRYDLKHEHEAANVPEVCNLYTLPPVGDIYKDYRCLEVDTANYTLVKLAKPEGHLEACDNGMCCSLDYSAVGMDESYYLAVFNGTHSSFDRYFFCEELCFVARCDDFNGSECKNFRTRSRTVFRKLRLKANFTSDYVYPSLMNSGLRLQPRNEWSYDIAGHKDSYNALLTFKNRGSKSMLVAGMYSRCFDRDPPYVR